MFFILAQTSVILSELHGFGKHQCCGSGGTVHDANYLRPLSSQLCGTWPPKACERGAAASFCEGWICIYCALYLVAVL